MKYKFIFIIVLGAGISCSSVQEIPAVKETPPAVEKRAYPIPSPTERKQDENGCQIYQKENFPPTEGAEDGRFTLGVKGRRIMYGYPMPISTSHFVVQVNDLYGSNSNVFGCKAEFILSKGNEREKIFQFHGIEIAQKLIPVTKTLQETESIETTQYYKIEYQLKNLMDYPQKVNFSLLVDTMVDDNDAAKFYFKDKIIESEHFLASDEFPDNILVFQEKNNFKKTVSEFLIRNRNTKPADELYIGKWPEFHKVLDTVQIDGDQYLDSAVLMRWKEMEMGPSVSKEISTYYGLHTGINGGLQLRYNQASGSLKNIALFFDSGSAGISLAEKKKLDEFISQELKEKKILGIAVTGYSDAPGSDKLNLDFSRKRANAAFQYIRAKTKLSENLFILKFLGKSLSLNNKETLAKGNRNDRRVEIQIFVE